MSKAGATSARGVVQDLVITRIFDAPRELVWKAWTEREHMVRWAVPHGFELAECAIDLRPGGIFHHVMRAPDGLLHPMKGIYAEIVPPERLVMTTRSFFDENGVPGIEAHNTITLTAEGARTRLELRVRILEAAPTFAEATAGMEPGWNQMLDRLAALLADL